MSAVPKITRRSQATVEFHANSAQQSPHDCPDHVKVIRTLGNGRAATARLVDSFWADGRRQRCVEKVFKPGRLTRLIYRIAFAAPFAYQVNQDAILACYYRRKVAAAMMRQSGLPVSVANPIYVRYDRRDKAWVLACDFIDGRGPLPAIPLSKPNAKSFEATPASEMRRLVDLMGMLETQLVEFGLSGSGWQVAPRAMVSTANVMIQKRTSSAEKNDQRYVVVDLESGIPSVLVPRYLILAWRKGSVFPFDDLCEGKLREQATKVSDHWIEEGANSDAETLNADVDHLIRHSRQWKRAELAPFRAPWTWVSARRRESYRSGLLCRLQTQQILDRKTAGNLSRNTLSFWLFWTFGCLALLPGGKFLVALVGNQQTRSRLGRFALSNRFRKVTILRHRQTQRRRWINSGRIDSNTNCQQIAFLVHQCLAWSTPRFVHRLLTDRKKRAQAIQQTWLVISNPRSQNAFGLKLFSRMIRLWRQRDWISREETSSLRRSFSGRQMSVYSRGLAMHLGIKTLYPVMAPLKFGGAAIALAGASWWYAILPFAILPCLRTLVTLTSLWRNRHSDLPHGTALLVGMLPTAGSLAFVLQMGSTDRQISTFFIRDIACRLGRRLPIYGGRDSRTEHAALAIANSLTGYKSETLLDTALPQEPGKARDPSIDEPTILEFPTRSHEQNHSIHPRRAA